MSLDDRVTGKDAPPPAPPARPRPALRPRQAPDPAAVPLAAAAVKPGQTLVFATPDASMSPDRAQQMREQLAERLPGVEIVIVAGVAQMAVYDPGTAGEGRA